MKAMMVRALLYINFANFNITLYTLQIFFVNHIIQTFFFNLTGAKENWAGFVMNLFL